MIDKYSQCLGCSDEDMFRHTCGNSGKSMSNNMHSTEWIQAKLGCTLERARFMAAAPELLQALKLAVLHLPAGYLPSERAKTAIAKAEGRG